MKNATGKESRVFEAEELYKLSEEAIERKAPVWVNRELRNQAWAVDK